MSSNSEIHVEADRVAALTSAIFQASGIQAHAADTVADALVEADLEGQHSHGLMLTEMYVNRIAGGSVAAHSEAEIVSENQAVAVLDAGNALGHTTGDQAMAMACDKADEFGAGITAVRNGFHFGTARRFALAAASRDLIGIAMCNTRPLMPAPGGAERLVGNNPLAIALPADGDLPIVLDMATSEAAMGKIRVAAKAGDPIPATWATDNSGTPTTDPNEAIAGMLLPTAGPKGFGLAFIIDLLCGLLSGGAWGDTVLPLYGDPAEPYRCSHLFIAISPAHFGDPAAFKAMALAAIERVHHSKAAPGTSRLYVPGEPEWARKKASGNVVGIDAATLEMLIRLARDLSVPTGGIETLIDQSEGTPSHAEA